MNSYAVHFDFDVEVNADDEADAMNEALEAVRKYGIGDSDIAYVELLEED